MKRQLWMATIVAGAFLCTQPMLAQTRDQVRQAQQALKDKGFDPGDVDGVDGPRTRAAIRDFQKQQNLQADGRLGPQTLDSLGVSNGTASTDMHEAGTNIKSSYKEGGEAVAHDTKAAGSEIKHGHPVDSAKDFGKGVGHGAKDIGVGTGHAVKNAARGVKDAVQNH